MVRIVCGDIEVDGLYDVINGHRIDLVFTDPPWNRGIAQMFCKWAGHPRAVDLSSLYGALARNLRQDAPDAIVYIMMGAQGIATLETAMKAEGYRLLNRWSLHWKDRTAIHENKFELLRYSLRDIPMIAGEPENGDTEKLLQWVIDQEKPRSILDPFVGHGATVRVAVKNGIDVFGMDINASFISVAERIAEQL